MDRHEWTDTETGYLATAESISAPERPGLEGWRRAAAAGREILRLAAWVKEADSTIRRLKCYLSDTEAARLAALADNRILHAEVAKWKTACKEEIAKLMPCQEENERLGWRVKELEAKILSLGRERAELDARVEELEGGEAWALSEALRTAKAERDKAKAERDAWELQCKQARDERDSAVADANGLRSRVLALEAGRGIPAGMLPLAEVAGMQLHEDTTASDIAAHAAAKIKKLRGQRDEEKRRAEDAERHRDELQGALDVARRQRKTENELKTSALNAAEEAEARVRELERFLEKSGAVLAEQGRKLARVEEWAREAVAAPWREEVRHLKAELEKADMRSAEKAGGAAIFFERWKGASQEIEGLQKRIDTLEYQLGNARDDLNDLNHQLAVADRRVAVAQGRAKELDGLATQRRYRIEELELTVAAHQKAHRDDASALNDLWRRIEALEKERDVTRARLEEPVTYGCIAEELLDAFPALLTALSQRLDQGSEPALLARCRYLLQRFQDMAELQSRAEREG